VSQRHQFLNLSPYLSLAHHLRPSPHLFLQQIDGLRRQQSRHRLETSVRVQTPQKTPPRHSDHAREFSESRRPPCTSPLITRITRTPPPSTPCAPSPEKGRRNPSQ
jgi:hypothetical protein